MSKFVGLSRYRETCPASDDNLYHETKLMSLRSVQVSERPGQTKLKNSRNEWSLRNQTWVCMFTPEVCIAMYYSWSSGKFRNKKNTRKKLLWSSKIFFLDMTPTRRQPLRLLPLSSLVSSVPRPHGCLLTLC